MEIGTEKIIEAYSGASTETVGVLNRMLGTDVPAVGFVKTFDEAVESLGSDHPVVRRYRRKGMDGDTEAETFERLRVVTAAVNRFLTSILPPPIYHQATCTVRKRLGGTPCFGSTHPRRRRTWNVRKGRLCSRSQRTERHWRKSPNGTGCAGAWSERPRGTERNLWTARLHRRLHTCQGRVPYIREAVSANFGSNS